MQQGAAEILYFSSLCAQQGGMHFIFLKSKWCSAGRGWDVTSSFIPQLGVYNNCSIKGLNSSPNDNFYSSVNWDTWLNNWVLCSLGGADFLLAKLWCMTFVVWYDWLVRYSRSLACLFVSAPCSQKVLFPWRMMNIAPPRGFAAFCSSPLFAKICRFWTPNL